MNRGIEYAKSIVSGEEISGELEYLACKRFLDDLERDFEYVFDETRAQRIVDFIENHCCHVKGIYAGQLIKLLPFQVFDLINIFGWVNKLGARRFTRAFIEEGRGNAKSAVMSCVALYGMTADCIYPPYEPEKAIYEHNPSVVCAAYDKEQAKIIWQDACDMGKASKNISKRLNVKKTYVEHKTRDGHMKALSKDTKNKDGMSVTIAIADEIHVWPTSEIMDVILSGFGKRAQNLFCAITTAGKDAENSAGKKEHDICEKILRGEIKDDNYFTVIRQLDKNDSPHNFNLLVKANPMLRYDNEYSQSLRNEIERNHNIAYETRDYSKIREYLIKRCCLWQVDSEKRFMDGLMDKYKSLAVSRDEFLKLVHGKQCYSGTDISKKIDLTGNGYVFPLDDGRFAVCAHGWLPLERIRWHMDNDKMDYEMLQKDGWCTIQDGGVIDTDGIIEYTENLIKEHKWKITEWCIDPATAFQFATDLKKTNYSDEQVIEIRQGPFTLSEPTKFFRELVINGKLVHDGSPLLTWCVSNAIEVDKGGGLVMLSKKHKDDSQRIDLLAATINAMRRAMMREEKKLSAYETRGMRSLL